MTATVLNMSDLVRHYKEAKSDEEKVIAIIDIVNKSQENSKKEILAEIRHDDLVTKQYLDLKISEIDLKIANVELKITKHVNNTKWQVIGSMLVFFIAGITAKHFGF